MELLSAIEALPEKGARPELHRKNLVETIRLNPGITRSELGQKLKISPALVNRYVRDLQERKWVLTEGKVSEQVGRKHELLEFNHLKLHVETFLLEQQAIHHMREEGVVPEELGVIKSQREWLQVVRKFFEKRSQETSDMPDLVVLCVDGHAVSEHGLVSMLFGVNHWQVISLENIVSSILKCPVLVVCRTRANVHHLYLERQKESFAYLKLWPEISMARVVGNVLQEGRIGTSGPLSHLNLGRGSACEICGGKGCLESLKSEKERVRYLLKHEKEIFTSGLPVKVYVDTLDENVIRMLGPERRYEDVGLKSEDAIAGAEQLGRRHLIQRLIK